MFSVNPLENPDDPTGAPPNLAFLEILTEFTGKLLKQDKKVCLTNSVTEMITALLQVVLGYLDKRVAGGVPNSRGEDWAPLHMYRNSLVHGEAELGGVTGGGQAKRQYNKKRRRSAEEGEEEDPDDPDYR